MEYRQLGKTGLKVSIIGIGNEHLKKVSAEEIARIFSLALSEGVNYFDLVWSFPNIIEGLDAALKKDRSNPVLAFHLGSCLSKGKYKRSRDPSECERHLRMLLERLNLNYAPVVTIHYVPNLRIWKEINLRGVVSLAGKLKEEGLAKAISVSTHDSEVVRLAAESGVVDCVMHQVNAASHMFAARTEALRTCCKLRVGVVAMKPFAGGELLKAGKKVVIPIYKTGWKMMTVNVPQETTSAKLLSYTLDQPSVCTAVVGISSLKELAEDLLFLNVSKEDRDYSGIIENFWGKGVKSPAVGISTGG